MGGEEAALAVHLTLYYIVIVCHQDDVCENYIGSVYDGGYFGLSDSGLKSYVDCDNGGLVVR